jgi:hypothetical protein
MGLKEGAFSVAIIE